MEKFTDGDWIGFDGKKWFSTGDWDVSNDEHGSFSYVAVGSGEQVICLVVSDSLCDDEMEANANLISQSKAMYLKLKEISESNCHVSEFYDEISDILSKARGNEG